MKQQWGTIALLTLILCLSVKGVEAYGFHFEDSAGKTHTLSDYKGKWVLVNFWATWCPPCLKEIPDLSRLSQERNDIVIIGIAMEYDNTKDVMQFVKKMAISYPIVLGDRAAAAQIGDDISMLPSTYLFDPDGKPAARKIGLITRAEIETFIDAR
ncbi:MULTISPECIES: TlpA family protein disulfide reductase [Nitrosomonas]|uniref:TlpA family protein disulfide reductase n=1 Tax=Nitrosomonas TaxID=914 RepID=UPI0008877F79|nr:MULTISPECIES: TlpA disulfide reductase family protein [Nitrosomonas]MXS79961.1 TlpA family protein disulfide reductase [Nitrosomonas sp. GH22]SCX28035.1 Thiol-disulfide isomerase or thioredoxin [Nitrosomonas eutropha]SDW01255.1 Thiol-disulfide isomerase or thioredoxin [Nitrosomonas eutropha]SEJ19851.1 Thiol-disulfide isomerase or thioredoxin [Nitrosomonas eutropha]